MGILDTTSEATKQTDVDEILGFLASLDRVIIHLSFQSLKKLANTDYVHLYTRSYHLKKSSNET